MQIILSTTIKKISLIFFMLVLSFNLAAQTINVLSAHQQLKHQAEVFVMTLLPETDEFNSHHNVTVAAFDRRLKIPDCTTPFHFTTSSDPSTQSSITVKASCPGTPWYLYFVAKIARSQTIVVAKYGLSPGTVLNAENVTLAEQDIKVTRQTLHYAIEDVIGTKVKRRIRTGQPITATNLCFVCKGDNVIITSGNKALAVKTLGVADQDGKLGDTISVTNQRSGKRVRGRVVDVGKIQTGI